LELSVKGVSEALLKSLVKLNETLARSNDELLNPIGSDIDNELIEEFTA